MSKKLGQKPKPSEEVEVEPDAWERFERGVDALTGKRPPKPEPDQDKETG